MDEEFYYIEDEDQLLRRSEDGIGAVFTFTSTESLCTHTIVHSFESYDQLKEAFPNCAIGEWIHRRAWSRGKSY